MDRFISLLQAAACSINLVNGLKSDLATVLSGDLQDMASFFGPLLFSLYTLY